METKFQKAEIISGVVQPIVELIPGLGPGSDFEPLFMTHLSAYTTHWIHTGCACHGCRKPLKWFHGFYKDGDL